MGLHKAPSKIKTIIDAHRPDDTAKLLSFLELITYYSCFLPQRAEKLKTLYDCARKEKFEWSRDCEQAITWVKNEIASERVLAQYDPSKKLILACDASAYGLSAILSHEYENGTECPISFASKTIPEKELELL